MARGDSGSQGDNSGVDKEWRSEEDALVCLGAVFLKLLQGP